MKKFILKSLVLALAMSSLTAHAGANDTGSNQDAALEMTGFKKLSEDKSSIAYQFRDEKKLLVSKQGFSNRSDAEKFCTDAKLKIADLDDVLLIAFSGAAGVDANLKKAISFKVEKVVEDENREYGGLISWLSADDKKRVKSPEDVVIIPNGQGMSSYPMVLAELNEQIASLDLEKITLPVVCSK